MTVVIKVFVFMDLCKGLVVKAKAGRDKDDFFIVMDFNEKEAFICNGKRRKIEKPKKKNIKHLALTNTVSPLSELTSNKKIKSFLNKFEK